jgi:hypothetical protein
MDLLHELRRKVSMIDPHDHSDGIKAAIRHIERAEHFLERGRRDQDPNFFNDVIYRTNQAFEGMLKEAYAVIEDTDGTRLSINEIEQHFLANKQLTERVLDLFKNYRQQWRNPATHDHKLLFSEEEALLAIMSVSAFAVVLLDQIVETISFKRQRAVTSSRLHFIPTKLETAGLSFAEQTVKFIQFFLEHELIPEQTGLSEAELVGTFSGFLAALNLNLDIQAEVGAKDRGVDLRVARGKELVGIQLKYGRFTSDYVEATVGQLRTYMSAAHANGGILVLTPSKPMRTEATKVFHEGNVEIWIIRPAERISPAKRPSLRKNERIR